MTFRHLFFGVFLIEFRCFFARNEDTKRPFRKHKSEALLFLTLIFVSIWFGLIFDIMFHVLIHMYVIHWGPEQKLFYFCRRQFLNSKRILWVKYWRDKQQSKVQKNWCKILTDGVPISSNHTSIWNLVKQNWCKFRRLYVCVLGYYVMEFNPRTL